MPKKTKKKLKTVEVLKCERCGFRDAEVCIDPYDRDVNGWEREAVLCDRCREERAADV